MRMGKVDQEIHISLLGLLTTVTARLTGALLPSISPRKLGSSRSLVKAPSTFLPPSTVPGVSALVLAPCAGDPPASGAYVV